MIAAGETGSTKYSSQLKSYSRDEKLISNKAESLFQPGNPFIYMG